MDNQSSLICNIIVGKIKIHLKCPSIEYAKGIREYFNAGQKGDPDINIDLMITAENDDIQIPESLFTTKSVQDNHFIIKGNSAKGYFDPDQGKGSLQVHYLLTSSMRTRLFEQLLYQAFYSASKKTHYDAILIHSCGVIRDNTGFLFVGKGGSGKSTIAELSKEFTVLNDEITMLEFEQNTPVIYSTPFNGCFKAKTKGSAELKAIFLLHQANTHRITREKESLAVKTIFSEIVPVIGLEEAITPQTHINMLDYAATIAKKTPVYKLEFLPDPGFWEEIYKKINTNGV